MKSVLHILAYSQSKPYLRFLMSIAYFHSHKYSSCKSIRESRNRFFSKNWIGVSWQPSIPICREEPVSTKWLQNTSKWFNIFKKLQNWKNLVFTLLGIQALLIHAIIGEKTSSRFKFKFNTFLWTLPRNYYL